MDGKLIDYSRIAYLMAQQDLLGPEEAIAFVKEVVPRLVAELEIMQGVVENVWSGLAAGAPPSPEAPVADLVQPPARASSRKPAKARRRRSKGVRK
jgi:hypothetical protein